jgi:hypothetical protein
MGQKLAEQAQHISIESNLASNALLQSQSLKHVLFKLFFCIHQVGAGNFTTPHYLHFI